MDFAAQLAQLNRKATQVAARRPADDRPAQRRRPNPEEQNHPAHPFSEMERRGYRLQLPTVQEEWKPKEDRSRPHICLLAITIADLPLEDIWKAWATDSKTNCVVSLVAHAKYPHQVQSEWLRQRLLRQDGEQERFKSHVPEWGSVQITRAMIDGLRDGLQIGTEGAADLSQRYRVHPLPLDDSDENASSSFMTSVDKFIFISESCLPVVTLDEAVSSMFFSSPRLISSDTTPIVDAGPSSSTTEPSTDSNAPTASTVDPWDVSWVNARNYNTSGTPSNMYERDQFRRIHNMIPENHRWKADQWLLLSRRHALAIHLLDAHLPEREQLYTTFSHVKASDEMYFPTALSLVGFLTEDDASSPVLKRPVTYTDWSEGMRNPVSFAAGEKFTTVAALARARGCLVARKFVVAAPRLSVETWSRSLALLPQGEKDE
jgi:Core-2/I-Branching enzyme